MGTNNNEFFKVRNGLSVGTTISADASTGNLTIAGDLTVSGNDIKSSTGATAITLSGANVISAGNIAGDSLTTNGGYVYGTSGQLALTLTTGNVAVTGDLTVTGNDIKGSAGTTAITLNGTDITVAGTANATTVDATNLEVTNIKAKDGTAAIAIADSTGSVTVSTDLTVDNINVSGNTIISTNTDGNITLDPNGTGDVVLTFANGGNLTNNRNFVHGAIRNATTESIGDIWAVNSTGPSNPFRGASLDNSGDTTRGPATVLRSYSGGAVSGSATRGRLIFEKARGTAASPTAVQVGDFLGSIDATGYTSTGWINDNVASVNPCFFGFNASENWVSNTNLGTAFTLSMTPTATTITSSANLVSVLQLAPESNVIRGDRMAISQGKTAAFTATGCSSAGNTLTIGTLTSGTIVPGQVIVTTGLLNGFYIVSNVSGSGSGSQWILSGNPGTTSGQAITANAGMIGSNPTVSATIDALQDLRLLKNTIKSQGGVTQITTSFSGNTLALAGDTTSMNLANGTTIASFSDAKIVNNRPHRSAVTTATVARGSTYTPAAGVNNFIELTLTTGTDPTYIDVDNLTVAGEGGHQAILVYNNSGSSIGVGDLRIRNNGVQISDSHSTVADGARAIFTVYCIGNYASCEFMPAA